MKATIENPITQKPLQNSTRIGTSKFEVFVFLLNLITKATTPDEMKDALITTKHFWGADFRIGFGSSHMWVHEVTEGVMEEKRAAIVYF